MKHIKRIFTLTSITISLTLLCAAFLPAKEAKGWKSILPNKSLKGWSIHPIPPTAPLSPAAQWSLDKTTGYLVCSGKGGHDWLRYDRKTLSDFAMQVEWRFVKLAEPAKYNSGIFVRNNADATIWHQAQTGDASGGYLFGVTPSGDKNERFNTREQAKSLVKPAGEWNTFEIICKGKTITLKVNGETAMVWDQCGYPNGYIGLEAEGYAIEFRAVRIRKLNKKGEA